MNRIFCVSMLAALLMTLWLLPILAHAEDTQEPITVGPCTEEIYICDLNGDGADEEISISWVTDQYDMQTACLSVRNADGATAEYPTEIMSDPLYYVIDLDPADNMQEILVVGDVMSADYYTWVLRYNGENLSLFPFNNPDSDGYLDGVIPGYLLRFGSDGLVITDNVDVLGTWWGNRTFRLTEDKSALEIAADSVWTFEYDFNAPETWDRCLELTRELPYTGLTGESAALPAGAKLLITETDAATYVLFRAEDGSEGRFEIAPSTEEAWGREILGIYETEWFAELPYAG